MYKIGDRVKVVQLGEVDGDEYYSLGDTGTISQWGGEEPNNTGAWVQFDNPKVDDGLWFVLNTDMEKI